MRALGPQNNGFHHFGAAMKVWPYAISFKREKPLTLRLSQLHRERYYGTIKEPETLASQILQDTITAKTKPKLHAGITIAVSKPPWPQR